MPCYNPITVMVKKIPTVVPCSRCTGCRLERSRQWAIRCVNEASVHEKNSFLTFTYRDENLVYGYKNPTLVPVHLEKFWKKLRKKYGMGIKYFACGEYGERFKRPHYHACVFGIDFEDKKIDSSKNGQYYYHSCELDLIWGFGKCIIGDVTFESAAYVSRYIMSKKLGKEAVKYEKEGIEPEFVRMSRRPGIGLKWLEKYSGDVFNHDYQIIRGGIKCKPPRYYTEKFRANEPEIMDEKKRINSEKNFDNQEFWNKKRLEIKEKVKVAQIKSLKRDLD